MVIFCNAAPLTISVDPRFQFGRLIRRGRLSGSAPRAEFLCKRLSLRGPRHSCDRPGDFLCWHRRKRLQDSRVKTNRTFANRCVPLVIICCYQLPCLFILLPSTLACIGIGLICCILRILFCICPSSCITGKKLRNKKTNKVDADYTTSLLRSDQSSGSNGRGGGNNSIKRVQIARGPNSMQVSLHRSNYVVIIVIRVIKNIYRSPVYGTRQQ